MMDMRVQILTGPLTPNPRPAEGRAVERTHLRLGSFLDLRVAVFCNPTTTCQGLVGEGKGMRQIMPQTPFLSRTQMIIHIAEISTFTASSQMHSSHTITIGRRRHVLAGWHLNDLQDSNASFQNGGDLDGWRGAEI